jgi:hypothetical protein
MLSFSEKRGLQKVITMNLANLQAGTLPFAEKRTLQKEIQDAFAKLKEKLDIVEPQPATIADVNNVMPLVKHFIGPSQLSAMGNGTRGEEGQSFKDKFVEIAKAINDMPKVYGQDGKGDDAVVYLHYFKGGSDWYITEKDSEEEQLQAFGYAILNNDKQNAELGYINIEELIRLNVELDLYWRTKTLGQVKGVGEKTGTEDEYPKGDPDIRKMKNAVIDHGGEVLEDRSDSIAFTLHGGIGGDALLSYSQGEGYRVMYQKGAGVTEYFPEPYDAVKAYSNYINGQGGPHQNQKLTDLIAGKYNNEPPEVFLKVLKDIVEEINDIEPVKPPTITYIETNQDKIEAIMESALSEVFGKLWTRTNSYVN